MNSFMNFELVYICHHLVLWRLKLEGWKIYQQRLASGC